MDGSSNREHFKVIDEAGPDIYIVGRSGLFGLSSNIEEAWDQMVKDYEETTNKSLL